MLYMSYFRYNYSINNDIISKEFCQPVLTKCIQDHVDLNVKFSTINRIGDQVIVITENELSTNEQSELNAIVYDHKGVDLSYYSRILTVPIKNSIETVGNSYYKLGEFYYTKGEQFCKILFHLETTANTIGLRLLNMADGMILSSSNPIDKTFDNLYTLDNFCYLDASGLVELQVLQIDEPTSTGSILGHSVHVFYS